MKQPIKECLYLAEGNHCCETDWPCYHEDTKACGLYLPDIDIPDTEEIENALNVSPTMS